MFDAVKPIPMIDCIRVTRLLSTLRFNRRHCDTQYQIWYDRYGTVCSVKIRQI